VIAVSFIGSAFAPGGRTSLQCRLYARARRCVFGMEFAGIDRQRVRLALYMRWACWSIEAMIPVDNDGDLSLGWRRNDQGRQRLPLPDRVPMLKVQWCGVAGLSIGFAKSSAANTRLALAVLHWRCISWIVAFGSRH